MHQQIKELLERYIKGECSDEEIALLEEWFDRIADAEGLVRNMDRTDEERLVRRLRGSLRKREDKILRDAAVWLGIVLVSGGVWWQYHRQRPKARESQASVYTVISTGYQQARKVILPDSSVVWLNSATRLAFPTEFTTHREVRLSGEAFFEVRPDAGHPFEVEARNARTVVIGTSFNVSAYPAAGEVRISLKSGRVGVAYGSAPQKVLSPGQLLVLDRRSGEGQVLQQEPGEMDEWTGGRLLFYKTPLKEALAQIEARYGVHIVYEHMIKGRDITARFDNMALEKVLAYLSFGWDLHFIRVGDTLRVR